MLLLTGVAPLALVAAPSFDSFFEKADGRWSGASYTWTPHEAKDSRPLGVAPGYLTLPTESATEVKAVMRSCGGAVQGVQEDRTCGSVTLNRQFDGTSFFSSGSWAQAPTALAGTEDADLLESMDGFGVSVCLSHGDRSRRRVLVVVAGGVLACCDVAIEVHEEAEDSTAVASALLSGRLQCVVEAQAWEGGASAETLDGTPPPGQPWINARTRWSTSEAPVEGDAPLIPSASEGDQSIAYLPGGCWVRLSKVWTTAAGELEPGLEVEVGSLAVEAAEVKAISHAFSAAGALSRVRLTKILAVGS